MSIRALIVVLAILNAGVALWWAARPAASPPPPPTATATGVAPLQLLLTPPPAAATAPAAASPAPPAVAAATPPPASAAAAPPAKTLATAAGERCLSFGPYADQAAAESARSAAGNVLQVARVREVPEASSFRVMLNGVGDRAAAQALVARIKASGLSDYYIVGNETRYDIALGQYRNVEGAERRQAELAAAGFQAEVMPSGAGKGSRWWLDARTQADSAALRALQAPQQRSLDCAALR
ncbi:MAG TPA: SPOR domain-containing protein [Stenotrophomonas sp.]|nr:SPOR domain-containing protein [Stenotrophomonas sp.]